jgi:hypothetical protein
MSSPIALNREVLKVMGWLSFLLRAFREPPVDDIAGYLKTLEAIGVVLGHRRDEADIPEEL